MTEYLTKQLINLRRLRLAAESFPELRLYHAEGGFHVTPLVVVAHESLLVALIEQKRTRMRYP